MPSTLILCRLHTLSNVFLVSPHGRSYGPGGEIKTSGIALTGLSLIQAAFPSYKRSFTILATLLIKSLNSIL